MTIEQYLKIAYKAIDDKLGEDIKILKIGSISSLTDYFVISGASNERQVKAIADNIEKELEGKGLFVRGKEGTDTCNWVLLDYGDFIIHIFKNDDREFYNLERLWKDAPSLDLDQIEI